MLALTVCLLFLAWLLWELHRHRRTWPTQLQGHAGCDNVADRDLERVLSELRSRF